MKHEKGKFKSLSLHASFATLENHILLGTYVLTWLLFMRIGEMCVKSQQAIAPKAVFGVSRFNTFHSLPLTLSGAALKNINSTIGIETFTCGGGFLVHNLLALCNFLTLVLLRVCSRVFNISLFFLCQAADASACYCQLCAQKSVSTISWRVVFARVMSQYMIQCPPFIALYCLCRFATQNVAPRRWQVAMQT